MYFFLIWVVGTICSLIFCTACDTGAHLPAPSNTPLHHLPLYLSRGGKRLLNLNTVVKTESRRNWQLDAGIKKTIYMFRVRLGAIFVLYWYHLVMAAILSAACFNVERLSMKLMSRYLSSFPFPFPFPFLSHSPSVCPIRSNLPIRP